VPSAEEGENGALNIVCPDAGILDNVKARKDIIIETLRRYAGWETDPIVVFTLGEAYTERDNNLRESLEKQINTKIHYE
jgi:hypothetical protein